MTLGRAAAAEAIGTALLLAIVVGSGIMGERLAQGNAAVALLANSIATGAGLYTLIVILGPISGAHFNPIVSGVSVWKGRMSATTGRGLRTGADGWRFRRRRGGARNVWTADRSNFSAYSTDTGRGFWRSHRDIRACVGHSACVTVSRRGDSDRGSRFYYERLLVYLLNIVCQSRRNVCTCDDRHVRWDFAG